jgi:hypothetical protein
MLGPIQLSGDSVAAGGEDSSTVPALWSMMRSENGMSSHLTVCMTKPRGSYRQSQGARRQIVFMPCVKAGQCLSGLAQDAGVVTLEAEIRALPRCRVGGTQNQGIQRRCGTTTPTCTIFDNSESV